jgi:hypothetical protein
MMNSHLCKRTAAFLVATLMIASMAVPAFGAAWPDLSSVLVYEYELEQEKEEEALESVEDANVSEPGETGEASEPEEAEDAEKNARLDAIEKTYEYFYGWYYGVDSLETAYISGEIQVKFKNEYIGEIGTWPLEGADLADVLGISSPTEDAKLSRQFPPPQPKHLAYWYTDEGEAVSPYPKLPEDWYTEDEAAYSDILGYYYQSYLAQANIKLETPSRQTVLEAIDALKSNPCIAGVWPKVDNTCLTREGITLICEPGTQPGLFRSMFGDIKILKETVSPYSNNTKAQIIFFLKNHTEETLKTLISLLGTHPNVLSAKHDWYFRNADGFPSLEKEYWKYVGSYDYIQSLDTKELEPEEPEPELTQEPEHEPKIEPKPEPKAEPPYITPTPIYDQNNISPILTALLPILKTLLAAVFKAFSASQIRY